MHILVCIKQILDPEVSPHHFQIDRENKVAVQGEAALVINPFDENAIEVALQLKDRQKESIVTVLTMGREPSDKALRRALSMGCDEAIWLKDSNFEGVDPSGTAKIIARGIRHAAAVDLVLCGRQAGDWDMGQVGTLVAEELSLPYASAVFSIEFEENKLLLKREMERGIEILAARIPMVATITSASSNQPRLSTTKGILSSTRKKITVWSSQDLGVSEKPARLLVVEDLMVAQYGRETRIIDGENGQERGAKLAQHLAQIKVI
jgi:electron transfer flavoprotein beta subunit